MALQYRPAKQSDTAKQPGTAVSVGVASGVLVAANPDRVELTVCNDHATQIAYLRFGASAAVLNQGIRLGTGQVFTTSAYTGEIRAIATGAATPVTIVEV